MRMTNEEYQHYAEKHAPRSPVRRNLFNAFWIGGLIFCIVQFFLNLYSSAGMDTQAAGTAEAITMVLIGAVLTGFGVYDNIAKVAGAGTLVPITGFANAVASPALEFKTEGRITGTAAKMFVISGPVIVYGVSAGAVYGLILWLAEQVL